jgi:hypothetical protein
VNQTANRRQTKTSGNSIAASPFSQYSCTALEKDSKNAYCTLHNN